MGSAFLVSLGRMAERFWEISASAVGDQRKPDHRPVLDSNRSFASRLAPVAGRPVELFQKETRFREACINGVSRIYVCRRGDLLAILFCIQHAIIMKSKQTPQAKSVSPADTVLEVIISTRVVPHECG